MLESTSMMHLANWLWFDILRLYKPTIVYMKKEPFFQDFEAPPMEKLKSPANFTLVASNGSRGLEVLVSLSQRTQHFLPLSRAVQQTKLRKKKAVLLQ